METELILSFIGASVLLTLMPGPDNIFVLTESITRGRKNGMAISMGLVSGILFHITAAATGLSIIVQQSALVFQLVKYAGAAYLFYLAIKAYQKKPVPVIFKENHRQSGKSWLKLIKKGLMMNVLNPKVSLFFIVFFPQFISKDGISMTFQMIVLGVLFILQALVIFFLIATLAGSLSIYLDNTRFWKTIQRIKAGILGILGLSLALTSKS